MRGKALLLAMSIVAWSSSAFGFCKALACSDDEPGLACKQEPGKCPSGRPELFWRSSCMSFGFQMHGSQKFGIDYDAANKVALDAFATWQNADCGDGKHPSFRIENMGPMECGRHEYNKHGNANIFSFAEEKWPHDKPKRDIALTLITFDTVSGEIYDADIAINSANMKFAATAASLSEYDLASVLTHEIGHFLGLGHSLEPEATMRENYSGGSTALRKLHADDVAGICTLFPPDRDISKDSCLPRHGFSDQCGGTEGEVESNCSVPRAPRSRLGFAFIAAAAALTLCTRRVVRRR